MTEIEFNALAAQGYNRIPLLGEAMADLDTPLGLYLKLTDPADRGNTFLLESVVNGENLARHSFVGAGAYRAWSIKPHIAQLSLQIRSKSSRPAQMKCTRGIPPRLSRRS